LRQILLVALTAIAAVTIGQALRQAVDPPHHAVNATRTPARGAAKAALARRGEQRAEIGS